MTRTRTSLVNVGLIVAISVVLAVGIWTIKHPTGVSKGKSGIEYKYTADIERVPTTVRIEQKTSVFRTGEETYAVETQVWVYDKKGEVLSLEFNELDLCIEKDIEATRQAGYAKAEPIAQSIQKIIDGRKAI